MQTGFSPSVFALRRIHLPHQREALGCGEGQKISPRGAYGDGGRNGIMGKIMDRGAEPPENRPLETPGKIAAETTGEL